MKSIIFLFSLLFFLFAHPVYGSDGDGGYLVTPHNDSKFDQLDDLEKDIGEINEKVSFQELPLWIKAAYFIGILAGVFSILKALPVISARIKNVLENIHRQKIFKYVLENPGTNIEEISSRFDIKRSTLRHHLRLLTSDGKIITKKIGRHTRIYQNSGAYGDSQKNFAAMMRKDSEGGILRLILENPGISNKEISKNTSLDKSTVSRHLQTFDNAEILRVEKDGKFKKYFVREEVRNSLLRYY